MMIHDESILQQILKQKKLDLADRKKVLSPQAMLPLVRSLGPTRSLVEALRNAPEKPAVIAEMKKAAPSSGLLRADFQPEALAKEFIELGAAAICVVTDRTFFQGDLNMVRQLRAVTELPLLLRDYIIDPYQLYEARYVGADAVLLTSCLLSNRDLTDFKRYGSLLGMDLLVEVHTREELQFALSLKFPLVGINNRDLRTFDVDPGTTTMLMQFVREAEERPLIVSEGGIKQREDVERVRSLGIDAVLVGEALMNSANMSETYRAIFG